MEGEATAEPEPAAPEAEAKPEGEPAPEAAPQENVATEAPKNVQSEHPSESEEHKGEGGDERGEGGQQEGEAKEGGEVAKGEGDEGATTEGETDVSASVSDAPPGTGLGARKKPDYETDSLMRFYKYMGMEPEEAEETKEVFQEVIKIDRGPYYEKHAALSKEMEDEKVKNNMLQKRVAQYFKKKKMDHVLKETGDVYESQQKYNKKLDTYGELIEVDARERSTIATELADLREKREAKNNQLIVLFNEMQQKEKETGSGLINTKTGKIMPEKMVERLLRLQRFQMDTINSMRLTYITLKYLVIEKQNKIAILDKIGENLYLKDYEQLKIENRGLEDKIEERDDELSKLRGKYQSNLQMLAHVREKSASLQTDIDNLKEEISVIDAQCTKVREQLNGYKQQRDYYRYMTNKINNESGLLNEMELLRDMEDSMVDLDTVTKELEDIKIENKVKAQQIRNIRKNIEYSTEAIAKKSTSKPVNIKSRHFTDLYKGRPTLYKPTIPEEAFSGLKEYKFKPSIGKSTKRKVRVK